MNTLIVKVAEVTTLADLKGLCRVYGNCEIEEPTEQPDGGRALVIRPQTAADGEKIARGIRGHELHGVRLNVRAI